MVNSTGKKVKELVAVIGISHTKVDGVIPNGC